jgi:hypothetical protein
MSTIAVFGMLATGSAYAASQIGTNDIKNDAVTARKLHNNAVTTQKIRNGAVTGAKVARHSLTGANILASSLEQVPSANHANSADNATNANTVEGHEVKTFFFKAGASAGGGTVLNINGIRVKASCDGSTNPVATVENESGVVGEIHGESAEGSSFTPYNTATFTSTPLNILGTSLGGRGYFTATLTNGVVVSVIYQFGNIGAFGGENVCQVSGTAIGS